MGNIRRVGAGDTAKRPAPAGPGRRNLSDGVTGLPVTAVTIHYRNGFSTATPKRLKSPTLRVTTVSLRANAVAAIIASS